MKSGRRIRAVLVLAVASSLALGGCGGMTTDRLNSAQDLAPAGIPEADRLPVIVGEVTARIDQPEEKRDAVCRYLRDIVAAEIGRQGKFILVGKQTNADLLAEFGLGESASAKEYLAPEAAFDIEILKLEEKLGATVKLGLASTQSKQALAQVKIMLRPLAGGTVLSRIQTGRSAKGAWGVIAAVDRDAMKAGHEEWQLDGSMIGLACADAVRGGMAQIASQWNFRSKTLDAGIEKQLVRPRAAPTARKGNSK